MFSLLIGAVISLVLIFVSRFAGLIPDRWNWWFFFTVIVVWGRLMTICYSNIFSRYMKKALELFDGEFDEEQKALLTVSAGHIFPPRLYNFYSFQVEPASVSSHTCLGAIVLLIASLFYEQYFVFCIALVVLLTGSKIWQPSHFYTGNYQMDIINAISLFFKKMGKNVRAVSETERELYISSFVSARDKFYRLWDEKNASIINNCGNA